MKLSRPQNMPEKLEGHAGQPITLETEVSRLNTVVKWWLNGREIVEGSNVTMTTDGVTHRLTIHSPTSENSGKYSCDVIDDKMDFQVTITGKNPEGDWCHVLILTMSYCFIRPPSKDPEEVGDGDRAQIPGI